MHRPAERLGEIGGRAVFPVRAVEQAHDALDDGEAAGAKAGPFRLDAIRAQGEQVEIDARMTGGGGQELGIDVIGTRFRRTGIEAFAREMAQQAQRHHRLAAVGRRRGDDDSAHDRTLFISATGGCARPWRRARCRG